MGVKTFKQLVGDRPLTYVARGMEKELPLELLLEQLDTVSGITSMDYKELFEEPYYRASVHLINFDLDQFSKQRKKAFIEQSMDTYALAVYAWQEDEGCMEIGQFLPARSYEELTLDQEIKRVAKYVPFHLLVHEKGLFGTLDTFHFHDKDTSIMFKETYSMKATEGRADFKIIKIPTEKKYTDLPTYWNKEIKPVLLYEKRDSEKCKALTEFSCLVHDLAEGMEHKDEPMQKLYWTNLRLSLRAGLNLIRSIMLNTKQKPLIAVSSTTPDVYVPADGIEYLHPSNIFMQRDCIWDLFENKTDFSLDTPLTLIPEKKPNGMCKENNTLFKFIKRLVKWEADK